MSLNIFYTHHSIASAARAHCLVTVKKRTGIPSQIQFLRLFENARTPMRMRTPRP